MAETMRHVDLFSGIGGFALAARWAGYQTEVFCERDEFCRKVLAKHWPGVPVVGDIHDFDGRSHAGADLLTGGIPCQPYSCAGKQLGDGDDRALWPQMRRVITEARPHWIVVENVAGFIGMALDGVLADLETQGYDCGTVVLPACAVNAPHRRDRVWVVANASNLRSRARGRPKIAPEETAPGGEAMADASRPRPSRAGRDAQRQGAIFQPGNGGAEEAAVVANSSQFTKREPKNQTDAITTGGKAWDESGNGGESVPDSNCQPLGRLAESWRECGGGQFEPRLGGMADGIPGRLDRHFDAEPAIPRVATGIPDRAARLKALGNAIVPQVAYQILKAIDAATLEPRHG